ncbi:MAG: hypothetical protein QGF23_01905 [Dehalococcoidales bacterium]|jgi:hypothetical protein|nr:hypothetical protein [Dehalococcoidales bacterium]
MLRLIASELKEHAPFTAFGAITGAIIMVFIVLVDVSSEASQTIFHALHPLHVVFSSLATTAMYRKHSSRRVWVVLVVGYFGSIGVATLSDVLLPYLGGTLLDLEIEFHPSFIQEWWLINTAALIGIAVGYLRPVTKFPHYGHVLLSTWASLFYFTAFSVAQWIPLIPLIFLFLFLAVWLPCCISDIVFPILVTGKKLPTHH